MHVRQLVTIVRRVLETASENQITFLAAAVAYYAFVSLVPLLAIVLVISAAIGGRQLVERLLAQTEAFLTPEAQAMLTEALVVGAGRAGATVVGALVLTWSALKVFRGVDSAFSLVYNTAGEKSILDGIVDGVIVVLAITLGVGIMTFVGITLRVLPLGPAAGPVAAIVVFGTLVVAFLPVYYVFPDRPIAVREAFPGAVLAAVGWTVLGSLFHVYIAVAGGVALYGALGGVLLLVTVLYAGAILLLLGAVVNAVVADRQLQQAGGRPFKPNGMTDEPEEDPEEFDPSSRGRGRPEPDEDELRAEIRRLREDLEDFETDIEDRTVHREAIEQELKRYVRQRQRRGHARGWGPYLVLLYGTAMTIGAFYYLSGRWAILAMIVIWLSTLGLFTLMVLVGTGLSVLGIPGRLRDRIGRWRS